MSPQPIAIPTPIAGPDAIFGKTENPNAGGVTGINTATNAKGFLGGADLLFHEHTGVYGESDQHGVFGNGRDAGTGVYGAGNWGIRGETKDGVAGIQGRSFGKGLAGKFIGDVEVTGDIRLTNADCAEHFDTSGHTVPEPGMVMVIDDEGALRPSCKAYDRRVAGVISGAGDYKPGIVLDARDTGAGRVPVALLGKTYCKADARSAPIEVGDLLTTSPTPGHAMKALDREQAFGAVIGKALRSLAHGQGMIPILIALQ
jgi:hypothetical protein